MRLKFFCFYMIGFFGLLILSCQSPTKKFEKPNVIIILTDDLGYPDVGFNRSHDIKTPNIDQITKNGGNELKGANNGLLRQG